MQKHSCEWLTKFVEDPRIPLKYDPILREYFMPMKHTMAIQGILFCPWCGDPLPESLRDEYCYLLEKEYKNYDPFFDRDRPGFPEEFKSDEWWKKRGL